MAGDSFWLTLTCQQYELRVLLGESASEQPADNTVISAISRRRLSKKPLRALWVDTVTPEILPTMQGWNLKSVSCFWAVSGFGPCFTCTLYSVGVHIFSPVHHLNQHCSFPLFVMFKYTERWKRPFLIRFNWFRFVFIIHCVCSTESDLEIQESFDLEWQYQRLWVTMSTTMST